MEDFEWFLNFWSKVWCLLPKPRRPRMILPNELPPEPKMLSTKALGVTTKTLAHGTMRGLWYTEVYGRYNQLWKTKQTLTLNRFCMIDWISTRWGDFFPFSQEACKIFVKIVEMTWYTYIDSLMIGKFRLLLQSGYHKSGVSPCIGSKIIHN